MHMVNQFYFYFTTDEGALRRIQNYSNISIDGINNDILELTARFNII